MAKRVVRVRNREDLTKLVRGNLVSVYGRVMAYHGIHEQFKEPTFVRPSCEESFMEVEIPLNPVFGRFFGGIRKANGYAGSSISISDPRYKDYHETAKLAGMVV